MANQQPGTEGLAILLHGVWRAMHAGACPNCHTHRLPELMDLAGLSAKAEDVSGKNRFDIRVGGHVVVEVKVDGSTDSVRRQLERYVSDPTVDCVLLLTTKQKHRSIGGLQFAKKVAVAYAIRF